MCGIKAGSLKIFVKEENNSPSKTSLPIFAKELSKYLNSKLLYVQKIEQLEIEENDVAEFINKLKAQNELSLRGALSALSEANRKTIAAYIENNFFNEELLAESDIPRNISEYFTFTKESLGTYLQHCRNFSAEPQKQQSKDLVEREDEEELKAAEKSLLFPAGGMDTEIIQVGKKSFLSDERHSIKQYIIKYLLQSDAQDLYDKLQQRNLYITKSSRDGFYQLTLREESFRYAKEHLSHLLPELALDSALDDSELDKKKVLEEGEKQSKAERDGFVFLFKRN